MSDYVGYEGRLIPLSLKGEELEKFARSTVDVNDEILKKYDNFVEYLVGYHGDNFYYNSKKNELFLIEREYFEPYEYMKATKRDDGSYDFIAIYYNGGACLEEVLDDII